MAHVQSTPRWPEHLRFIERFVRNPRTVGALAPSSKRLASAMVAPIARSATSRNIVELGPGTGAFTRAIVERLRPGDRFLAVELDPTFVEALRRSWPGVECVCASAESLCGLVAERRFGPVDHIVSGLPFATLPAHVTGRIVEAIGQTLRPGGTFTTFTYVQSYGVPACVGFRRQMNALMASTPFVRFVAWNLPPAFALTWIKG
jgi:phosphatidylethanolamine/phosphatidyl-N-methylethanolamine N-methyltransferase